MNKAKRENLVMRALNGSFLALPREKKCQFGEAVSPEGPKKFLIGVGSGVGGFIHVLSLAKNLGFSMEPFYDVAKTNLNKLLEKKDELVFDGIVYGRTGLAIAICDAYNIGILDNLQDIEELVLQFLNKKPDWPDFMYGAAGQGLAALYCASIIKDSNSLIKIAEKYANYLIKQQHLKGFWALPKGVSGLEGQIYYGFSHGSAGILYFLTEYARLTNEKKVFTILDKGFQFLLKGSIVNNNGQRYWPMSVTDKSYRYWWCHGSPGISLALLKLYESTRDIWEADIAKSALDGIPKQALSPSPSMNLSICHGLAGLGEIYLTAFQILKDRVWYERASEIATIIRLLSKDHHKYGITFYGEPQNPAIALWTGHLGVVHFLLRYSQKGLGRFPLLI